MRALPPDREDQAGKRTFRWRFFLYAIALLYLLGDLYLFQGPLRTRLAKPSENEVSAKALALREGIVATVNGHPIRREELDRAVGEYCLKRGLFPEAFLPFPIVYQGAGGGPFNMVLFQAP